MKSDIFTNILCVVLFLSKFKKTRFSHSKRTGSKFKNLSCEMHNSEFFQKQREISDKNNFMADLFRRAWSFRSLRLKTFSKAFSKNENPEDLLLRWAFSEIWNHIFWFLEYSFSKFFFKIPIFHWNLGCEKSTTANSCVYCSET